MVTFPALGVLYEETSALLLGTLQVAPSLGPLCPVPI